MNGMITPWSHGTPMKPTCASSVLRSSHTGEPKKVLIAERTRGSMLTDPSLLPWCMPRDGVAKAEWREDLQGLSGHRPQGTNIRDTDATGQATPPAVARPAIRVA